MFILGCVLIDINLIVIRFMKTSYFYIFVHIACTCLINIFIWVDIIVRNTIVRNKSIEAVHYKESNFDQAH